MPINLYINVSSRFKGQLVTCMRVTCDNMQIQSRVQASDVSVWSHEMIDVTRH